MHVTVLSWYRANDSDFNSSLDQANYIAISAAACMSGMNTVTRYGERLNRVPNLHRGYSKIQQSPLIEMEGNEASLRMVFK